MVIAVSYVVLTCNYIYSYGMFLTYCITWNQNQNWTPSHKRLIIQNIGIRCKISKIQTFYLKYRELVFSGKDGIIGCSAAVGAICTMTGSSTSVQDLWGQVLQSGQCHWSVYNNTAMGGCVDSMSGFCFKLCILCCLYSEYLTKEEHSFWLFIMTSVMWLGL
jgi:hypothetical protein